jgi:NAD(P)-dependent dehydrogenase (short-subunit alcohol dehydrogenase family)
MQSNVENRVVIVTGAGSGIGAGTARRFLREGAFVVLNGRRENKLHETLAGFDAVKALVHPGDVADEAYVKRLVGDTIQNSESWMFWSTTPEPRSLDLSSDPLRRTGEK